MIDSLVLDVLTDARTVPMPDGTFLRCGVIYVFTAKELKEAVHHFYSKIQKNLNEL